MSIHLIQTLEAEDASSVNLKTKVIICRRENLCVVINKGTKASITVHNTNGEIDEPAIYFLARYWGHGAGGRLAMDYSKRPLTSYIYK
jgi:hypothetical protein